MINFTMLAQKFEENSNGRIVSTFHSYILTLNSNTGSSGGVQCHLAHLLHLQTLLRHLVQHLQFRVFCFLIGVQHLKQEITGVISEGNRMEHT